MSPPVRTISNASYKGRKVLRSHPSKFLVFSPHEALGLGPLNFIYNVLTMSFHQVLVAFI